ncbi:hypothetical protein V8E55_009762 [Tylopilus felleus]
MGKSPTSTCADPGHRAMQTLRDFFRSTLFKVAEGGRESCYDCQYRQIFHGEEQRYVSPSTGKCRPLIVQAVHPKNDVAGRTETHVGDDIPNSTKLAVWLMFNPPVKLKQIPLWFMRWVWFTVALLWPFNLPKNSGHYPAYLSKYYGQLWAARSPRDYSLRRARLGAEPVHEITHSTHPRRLVIYDSDSRSWNISDDANIIKQQKYIVISYRYDDIVPKGTPHQDPSRPALEAAFITEVESVVASLQYSAYWTDLTLTARGTNQPEEIDKDVYRMADVYRGAEFTLIMLPHSEEVAEKDAWLAYGQRLWTFPEALLSRKLRFKFRDGEVTPITLHQLANRAYAGFAEESAIVNAYGLKDPLERLERLLLLKAALWRRTSSTLERLAQPGAKQHFEAERVYALMGFFEHRIHPHFQETELQALVRLSMANDNDRLVERMVSLLPSQLPDHARWYADNDQWGSSMWDIEPEIQVVGMTEKEALVIGGCRTAAIRWKNFPTVAFAMQRSFKRQLATYIPYVSWELLAIGAALASAHQPALLIVALVLMLFSPVLVAYGTAGRIVQAQPWLIGVKGLVSAEDASMLTYGASISELPRTVYSPSGTPLSQTETGRFRRGDPAQLAALKPRIPGAEDDDDLYSLIDTVSATVYYFRAARPPTVCLYTGRESGMGRFVLCSEKCTDNELHKETVIRMPWYISQFMPACDWVALG